MSGRTERGEEMVGGGYPCVPGEERGWGGFPGEGECGPLLLGTGTFCPWHPLLHPFKIRCSCGLSQSGWTGHCWKKQAKVLELEHTLVRQSLTVRICPVAVLNSYKLAYTPL